MPLQYNGFSSFHAHRCWFFYDDVANAINKKGFYPLPIPSKLTPLDAAKWENMKSWNDSFPSTSSNVNKCDDIPENKKERENIVIAYKFIEGWAWGVVTAPINPGSASALQNAYGANYLVTYSKLNSNGIKGPLKQKLDASRYYDGLFGFGLVDHPDDIAGGCWCLLGEFANISNDNFEESKEGEDKKRDIAHNNNH